MKRIISLVLILITIGNCQGNCHLASKKKPYVILSIDGGGIRGVIPAQILCLFEEEYGVRISEIVDCFAGTSTGGIIALGLAVPDEENPTQAKYSASWIKDLYVTKGETIFQNDLWHWLETLGGLLGPQYETEALSKLLEEMLGDIKLSELVKDTFITSYSVSTNHPFLFEHFGSYTLHDADLVDIALSTSAAPTYFPSYMLKGENLIDGGVFANDPAGWAYCELFKRDELNDKEVYILSLGTGEFPETPEGETSLNLISSAEEVITALFDATNEQVVELVSLLEKEHKIHFMRWQPTLISSEQVEMDNVSKENIESLQTIGTEFFQKHHLNPQFSPFREIFSLRAQQSKFN